MSLAEHFWAEIERLAELEGDQLLTRDESGFSLTPLGQLLVRHVAATSDAYLTGQRTRGKPLFSGAI